MQIEPIRKTSVVHDAISKIKELIDQEDFKFGEKLPPERELARLLGISLPSLREALRALSILGIAEMRPGSGTYLRSSMSDWSSDPFSLLFHLRQPIHLDLFEARMGIEGVIAELAAKKRTEEDLRAMEHALQRMRSRLGDRKEYITYEIQFHQAIIRAAKNAILADFMEKMYKVLFESRKRTVEQLRDVYLYTIDDLQNTIDQNMNSRRLAAEQAEEIIDTQVDYFLAWLRAQGAQSTIQDYRHQAEQSRDEALQKALALLKSGVPAEQALNRLAHSLTNKLIHTPSTQIRAAAENERHDLIAAAREIFKLSNSQ